MDMLWTRICILLLTLACCTLTGQTLVSLSLTNLSPSSVLIRWVLDRPAAGSVRYGFSPGTLDHQIISLASTTNQLLLLRGLEPGTTYYYAVCGATGSSVQAGNGKPFPRSFTTSGTPSLKILLFETVTNAKDRFSVRWKTSRPVRADLTYLRTDSVLRRTVSSSGYGTEGNLSAIGLDPLTPYYYMAEFTSPSGLVVTQPVARLTTAEDDLALSREVTGTFNAGLTNDPYYVRSAEPIRRLTDGRMNCFDGMAVSGDIMQADQEAVVDLGGARRASNILVFWRSLACSTNYSVSVSADAAAWNILSGSENALTGSAVRGERGDPILVNEIPVSGPEIRYVRIRALKGAVRLKHPGWAALHLMEIKVYP